MCHSQICAVIVTYNQRYSLLEDLLNYLVRLGIKNAVVFDNNDSQHVRPIFSHGMKVDHLGGRGNKGTSVGFGKAIEHAYEKNFEYCIVLDDDNRPEEDTICTLLAASKKLEKRHPKGFAISSRRDGYNSASYWFPVRERSKYVNVSLLGSPNSLRNGCWTNSLFKVRDAPYGGLFLKLSLLDVVGPPRADYYVYVDDLEFTNRISRILHALYHCPNSVVCDVEPQGIRRLSGISLNEKKARSYRAKTYYAVRNQVNLDKSRARSQIVFRLNSIVYVLVQFMSSFRQRHPIEHFVTILVAIYHGETGRMGFNQKYSL